MKGRFAIFLVTLALLFTWLASSPATVEWDVAGTLNLKEKARDAAMSLDGKWIFVLTEKGEILIYSSDGKLKDTISVEDIEFPEGVECTLRPKLTLAIILEPRKATAAEEAEDAAAAAPSAEAAAPEAEADADKAAT